MQERERVARLHHFGDLEVRQEGGLADVREAANRDARQPRHSWEFGNSREPEPGGRRVGDPRKQIVANAVISKAKLVDAAVPEHLRLTDRQVVRQLLLWRL